MAPWPCEPSTIRSAPQALGFAHDRLRRRALHEQRGAVDAALAQLGRLLLQAAVGVVQLGGHRAPHGLRPRLVADEVGIGRRHVHAATARAPNAVRELGRARDDVVGDGREVDRGEDGLHRQLSSRSVGRCQLAPIRSLTGGP